MGEIRNARCLLLQVQWLQYADQQVEPICRSRTGSITPVMTWLLYADHHVEPIGRSLTADFIQGDRSNQCCETDQKGA